MTHDVRSQRTTSATATCRGANCRHCSPEYLLAADLPCARRSISTTNLLDALMARSPGMTKAKAIDHFVTSDAYERARELRGAFTELADHTAELDRLDAERDERVDRQCDGAMILADTSVWIDDLRGTRSATTNAFDDRLGTRDVLVCGPVATELLTGCPPRERTPCGSGCRRSRGRTSAVPNGSLPATCRARLARARHPGVPARRADRKRRGGPSDVVDAPSPLRADRNGPREARRRHRRVAGAATFAIEHRVQ